MYIFLACSEKRPYTSMSHFRDEMINEGVMTFYYGSRTSNGGQIDESAIRGGIKAANVVLAIILEGDSDIEQIKRSIKTAGEFYKPTLVIIQNTALTPDLQNNYPDAIVFDEDYPEKIREAVHERAEKMYQSPNLPFRKEVIWKLFELAAKYFVETFESATQTA